MSTLGFGVFVGGVIIALAIAPKAFSENSAGSIGMLSFAFGGVAWMILPSVFGDVADFAAGAAIPPAAAFITWRNRIANLEDKRSSKEAEAAAEGQRLEQCRADARQSKED